MPEALRDRLARGHIYPAGQAQAALGGWFQTGNLSALRELTLLWLAATLAGGPRRPPAGPPRRQRSRRQRSRRQRSRRQRSRRQRSRRQRSRQQRSGSSDPGGSDPGGGAARERVVVALSGGPEGETLIRRAARIAARSGGDLLAVHAARPGRPPGSGRTVLAAQRQLAESAGGTYHHLADHGSPAALLAFAHANNATQLVLGATPRTWRPAARIRARVIRHGGGLDVHIITCAPTTNRDPAPAGETRRGRRC
jgi:two-component system sensor histidine kinase KdpD